ncbi:MAG: DUF1272 domain-containing protein [Thermoplasmata archaeon]|nr:DUF1272 domain-containing protein [Thermoplasmata archaeon]
MKPVCERCEAPLPPTAEAYICTFECTFCRSCYRELEGRCANCSGELVRRPRPAPLAQSG